MGRPNFPNCIMPPETIHRIRQEQDYYDEDPERYERQERAREEERQMEQRQMEEARLEEERREAEREY